MLSGTLNSIKPKIAFFIFTTNQHYSSIISHSCFDKIIESANEYINYAINDALFLDESKHLLTDRQLEHKYRSVCSDDHYRLIAQTVVSFLIDKSIDISSDDILNLNITNHCFNALTDPLLRLENMERADQLVEIFFDQSNLEWVVDHSTRQQEDRYYGIELIKKGAPYSMVKKLLDIPKYRHFQIRERFGKIGGKGGVPKLSDESINQVIKKWHSINESNGVKKVLKLHNETGYGLRTLNQVIGRFL